MKTFTLKGFLLILAVLFAFGTNAQDNVIWLAIASTGSEGDSLYTDESPMTIDESGNVVMGGDEAFYDWAPSGTVTLPKALNQSFSVLFGGMATTSTSQGADFGKMLTAGGIDRSSDGQIGIRGSETNGIDAGEGVYFGLDLTGVSADIAIQITGIGIRYLKDGEFGTITNLLNTAQYFTVSSNGDGGQVEIDNGSGIVDVGNFEIFVEGGKSLSDMISLFNSGDKGNFRINGLQITVIENSSNAVDNYSAMNDGLILGPNPFIHQLNIQFDADELRNSTVELFNSNGQLVLSSQAFNSQLTLNTSELAPGVYCCVLTNDTNKVIRRIIKK